MFVYKSQFSNARAEACIFKRILTCFLEAASDRDQQGPPTWLLGVSLEDRAAGALEQCPILTPGPAPSYSDVTGLGSSLGRRRFQQVPSPRGARGSRARTGGGHFLPHQMLTLVPCSFLVLHVLPPVHRGLCRSWRHRHCLGEYRPPPSLPSL